MQMTLRPSRSLYARYVGQAAERSKQEGRSVSVQEVMLEVLEQGVSHEQSDFHRRPKGGTTKTTTAHLMSLGAILRGSPRRMC